MIVRTAPPATPHQLGFLPLIVWGGVAAASAAAGAYAWWTQSDYDNFKANVQPPTPPPAPAAPQTKTEMTEPEAWTPETQTTANQYLWSQWRKTAIPDTPDTARQADNTRLWMAAGATGLALLLVLRG